MDRKNRIQQLLLELAELDVAVLLVGRTSQIAKDCCCSPAKVIEKLPIVREVVFNSTARESACDVVWSLMNDVHNPLL